MRVAAWSGHSPTLASVGVAETGDESLAPAPWILVVNSTHDSTLPGHGQEFITLARSIPGFESLRAQQIWVPDLNPEFLSIEPKPIAVFFSGSFKDWCEVDRGHWRGTEKVLRRPSVPIWASCGGAQALAIIADAGTRTRWDCPHCRDLRNPKIPIYTHIGHTTEGSHSCGNYSACIFERGPHTISRLKSDPVFNGLPDMFQVMESHCGQIEYPPGGWDLIATAGRAGRTKVQCIRRRDALVYAAQFHIEMTGTPESSRDIMQNFLRLATEAARKTTP